MGNIVEIRQRATQVLESCLKRMQAIGYEHHTLSYSFCPDPSVNAGACASSHQPVVHKILLNDGLLEKLDHVSAECASYTATRTEGSVSGIVKQVFSKYVRRDTRQLIFVFCLSFVFFHEVGHLNQQHRRLRDSRTSGFDNEDFTEAFNWSDIPIGEEALFRQVLELAADHEGICRSLDLVLAWSGPPDKRTHHPEYLLWIAMLSLTLVFHVFQGTRAPLTPLPARGIHPQPSARMIFLIRATLDNVRRRAVHFNAMDDAKLEHTVEDGIIAASQFWHGWFDKLPRDRVPQLHRHLQEPDFFQQWDEEITRVWNEVAPQLNEQRLCKGVPLPLRGPD